MSASNPERSMIKKFSTLSALLFLTFFLASSPSSAQTFTKIVAFGDSWTDPVAAAPDGPSYAYVLAGLMNLPIENNAVSGAITAAINQQIAAYVSGGVDPDALHIYWAVGNDFLEPGGQDDTSATNALMANNAAIGLDMLLQAGAQYFLVFNSIDNALRPITIAAGEEAEATAVSIEYNQLMRDVLIARGLQSSLFDSFAFFSDLVLDGRFINISIGCFSVSCNNPDQFVWWDNIHPSSESHMLIGIGAFNRVTAPAGTSPPTITSAAITNASVASSYRYDVQATDPDAGTIFSFQLINAPTGMTIDTASGVISWVPAEANIGENTIAVTVADNDGLTDTQGFTIVVAEQTNGGAVPPIPNGGGGGGSMDWLLMLCLLNGVAASRKHKIRSI